MLYVSADACSGGIWEECYNILGGTDKVIPVDCYVPGCAARPEAIIDGVVAGLGVLSEKRARMEKGLDPEGKDEAAPEAAVGAPEGTEASEAEKEA